MAQTFWHVRDCSLFQRLSDAQLESLERKARIKKFPKGSSIYVPSDSSDSTFLLAEGRIRICSTTPDGKQSILAFVEPGEVFGELGLIEQGLREERAEAVVHSSVVLIPSAHLQELMEESAPLTLGVTKLIGLRRKRIERRLRSLLFRNNRDRLVHLLVELAEQYGNATSEGIELGIRLSHQDLAAIIGATRETVTTLLGEMQAEGLLRIRRQRLLIRDLPKLASGSSIMTSAQRIAGKASSANNMSSSPNSTSGIMPRPAIPAREG